MGNAPLLLTILAALLPWTLARTHPGHAHHIKEKHAQDHHSNWVVRLCIDDPHCSYLWLTNMPYVATTL